jgi:isopentenyl diphosphate isomerase/L-lactate dehydrogenase-like FMN-dependent dehydrogenase
MGGTGVRHVMKSLLAEFDIMMNVAGCQSVDQIDRTWLESQSKSYSLVQERSKI